MYLFREATLELDREIRCSLKNIYGLGLRKAIYISSRVGLSHPFYLNKITPYYFSLIHFLLKHLIISDVRIKRFMEFNIARKINSKHIKGIRHMLSLPFMDNELVQMQAHNVQSV
jgi:ribosomal protein S13